MQASGFVPIESRWQSWGLFESETAIYEISIFPTKIIPVLCIAVFLTRIVAGLASASAFGY